MKETYPKNIVNAVVIVLVTIIIAVTFTMKYAGESKSREHCYKKSYNGLLVRYLSDEWSKDIKTKEEAELRAAMYAARECLKQ